MRRRLRHVPAGLAATAVVAVLAAVVGGALRGGVGALGAVAGIGLVAVSYLISGISVAWADSINPQLVLPVGLTTYAAKFTLLGVVMIAVTGAGWAGSAPMGLGIIAGTFAWTGAQLWWTLRARIPYVEIDEH